MPALDAPVFFPPATAPRECGLFSAEIRATITAMSEIVLATLNARYIHAAFGLRYLLANLGELRERAEILEFEINQRPLEVVDAIMARSPRILGLGVYIWNVATTTEVVALLKRVRPDLKIVLGGPEVSHETDGQGIVELADHVITGEADLAFAEVCGALLRGEKLPKVIAAALPLPEQLRLPYDLYSDADIAHRVLYVEASRGCPFTCEFCLSSLEVPVRSFALEPFLAALDGLLARGATQFKFVDRTFNLNLTSSRAILEFFLTRWREGLFVHFEMVPDRLPEALREVIAKFPPGALQFEVGIQTFDETTSRNISRRQNLAKLEDNLRFLRAKTGVHVHADLIVGLPGEDLASFGRGFDRLLALGPQEIQVGILKRLRGTPIVRHDAEWEMIYSPNPPYEILQNKLLDFAAMQRMRRFARFWDLVGNSGNFVESAPMLWSVGGSAFEAFLGFSDWVAARIGRHHSIALGTLAEQLFTWLVEELGLPRERVESAIRADWHRAGRNEHPPFLEKERVEKKARRISPKRQSRHLAGGDSAYAA